MQEEIGRLRDAVKALTKRKSCERRYIQVEETLTVGEVTNLITKKEGGRCEDSETPVKRVRAERHCGCCGETGHNSRTCKVEIEDADRATLLNNTIILPAVLYFVVVLRYAVVQALRWCFVGRSVVNHVISFLLSRQTLDSSNHNTF
jgi:hypothetical protein